MFVQTWGDTIVASLQNLWAVVLVFLPSLIVALIVIIVGWVVAAALGRVVWQIVAAVHADQLFEKLNFKKPLERAGLKLNTGKFLGELVKWFLILVFFMAAADILGLTEVTSFLQLVISYIPNIIVAVLILLAGAAFATFMQKLVRAGADSAELSHAGFVGSIAKWSILVFALFAAMDQLGVARTFIVTLLQGFVAMIAIAGGLAFGLGGQNAARSFLDKLRDEISDK
jgi:small-conductance mechanosensitive channel